MNTLLIISICIFAFLILVFIHDIFQRKHTILHNFPIVGHFRYIFEAIGPELRQYWVASDKEEMPFTRAERKWVYATSKNMKKYCEGARILYVKRRSKFGKIYLDNDYIIVFHLGMSGRMIIEDNPSFQKKKHDHILFELKHSAEYKNYIRFIYNDPRRFGFMSVYKIIDV